MPGQRRRSNAFRALGLQNAERRRLVSGHYDGTWKEYKSLKRYADVNEITARIDSKVELEMREVLRELGLDKTERKPK